MNKINIKSLSKSLSQKRGTRGIREVASEIGVSPATLSRVERGNVPDLQTFAKICSWLNLEPSDILGIKVDEDIPVRAAVHFRKDDAVNPELAKALADMIVLTQKAL